ncbi:hypothetical protein HDU76_007407 [Blyttiomyces sp. JEL0837]|nr:hypothetical protein HDU76_007407 [Blyttiomyces sp. JEL0837]
MTEPTVTNNQHHGDGNLWTRIPLEIKNSIMSQADPLTNYLNNPTPANLTVSQARSVWIEAFRQDWDGDLTLLPKYGLPSIHTGLGYVKSRSMYDRLCQLRPDLCHPKATHLQVYFTDNTRYGWFQPKSYYFDEYAGYPVVAIDEKMGDEIEDGGRSLVGTFGRFETDWGICNRMESLLIQIAMRHCWMDLLEVWISKNPVKVAMMAICGDHFELLKVLVKERKLVRVEELAIEGMAVSPYMVAAKNGNFEMLKFLHRNGCPPGNVTWVFEHAIRLGHFDMFLYICEHIEDFNRGFNFSLYYGPMMPGGGKLRVGTKNIEIWRWFWDLGVEKYPGRRTKIFPIVTNVQDAQTVADIMGEGNVDLEALKACAFQGDLSTFSILWSHRHRPSVTDLEYLPVPIVLAKLAVYGCNYDDANYSSTPEAIRLVHRHDSHPPNCSIDQSIRNKPDFIQRLVENCTCKTLICTTEAMDTAAEFGLFEQVVYLQRVRPEVGCTKRAMDLAAASGYIDIVRFLHENRQEGCTTDAIDLAATKGHLEVVKFLHENRQEGWTTAAMDGAARNGFLNVVRYLFLNGKEGCSPGALRGVCAAMGFGNAGDVDHNGGGDDDSHPRRGAMLQTVAFLLEKCKHWLGDVHEDIVEECLCVFAEKLAEYRKRFSATAALL